MSDADVKMPPLPETRYVLAREGDGYTADMILSEPGYSDDHLYDYAKAYARAAVLAERERCAKVCEAEHVLESLDTESGHPCDISYNTALRDAAAAIRKGTP